MNNRYEYESNDFERLTSASSAALGMMVMNMIIGKGNHLGPGISIASVTTSTFWIAHLAGTNLEPEISEIQFPKHGPSIALLADELVDGRKTEVEIRLSVPCVHSQTMNLGHGLIMRWSDRSRGIGIAECDVRERHGRVGKVPWWERYFAETEGCLTLIWRCVWLCLCRGLSGGLSLGLRLRLRLGGGRRRTGWRGRGRGGESRQRDILSSRWTVPLIRCHRVRHVGEFLPERG